MMVAAFSHSNAVGKLPLHLPDVPKGVRYEFPRYLPVEANTALQYYHRYLSRMLSIGILYRNMCLNWRSDLCSFVQFVI